MAKKNRRVGLAALLDQDNWAVSAKGNLWTRVLGPSVTLVEKGGNWNWCVATGKGVDWGEGGLATRDDAIRDAWAEWFNAKHHRGAA